MESAKNEQRLCRRQFTLIANKIADLLKDYAVNSSLIETKFMALELSYQELRMAHENIRKLYSNIIDSKEMTDEELEAQIEYVDKFNSIKLKILEYKEQEVKLKYSTSTAEVANRHYRLPKIELPSFDGEIKNWLAFWAQFKKIHKDPIIDNDDKLQYLLQCMEVGSSARQFVESFPPCGTNYQVAIEQLRQRFAKDELIVEHYVRELLQLVLAQSKGSTKIPIGSLHDKITMQVLALESMGVTQNKYAAFLYPLVEAALPEDLLRAWHRSHTHADSGENSLTNLLSFLKQEVFAEERVRMARTFSGDTAAGPSTSCFTTADKKGTMKRDPSAKGLARTCVFCDRTSHSSSECMTAMNKTVEERWEIIKQKKACGVCLNTGHYWRHCKRTVKCVICTKRHFPIMCRLNSKSGKNEDDKVTDNSISINQSTTSKTVLLQTLKIRLLSNTGSVVIRALLDSGAQRSFIKSDVAKSLNLKPIGRQELSHNLFGGNVLKTQIHNIYNVNLCSLDNNYTCNVDVLDQNVICGYLPRLHSNRVLNQLQNLGVVLTDCIDDNSEVNLLIGSDILGSLFTGRIVQVDRNLLAMESRLGWTIQGPVVGAYCSTVNTVTTLHCSIEDFWSLESMGIKDEVEVKGKKAEDMKILKKFNETICIGEDRRYEVRLPWRGLSKTIQPNFDTALKRLNSTTARLKKLGILEDYNKVFEEWLSDGIIETVEHDEVTSGFYLPHHAVVKESSLTTKIRPVFDASSKDRNGLSLNSCLEKGINLIEMIPKLLINFRRNAIGVTADIKKAFLQIFLNSNDRNYLKFLWWQDINDNHKGLKVFRHKRVVFGVTSSPFLLSATINFHLNKYDSRTASMLKKSFYVDNCILSVKDENEMNWFINEAKDIMLQGQFELRCWVTGPVLTDETLSALSVLGLMWDPRHDVIYCKMPNIKSYQGQFTKRNVLSLAQSVFDPLGFATPVTLIPKLILQKSWILNKSWDEHLPKELCTRMSKWVQGLHKIEASQLPRRMSQFDLDSSKNSLHIFCDASLVAYACCIFLRSELNGMVNVQLVFAKSRVAPTKRVTMPRLELMAALMATRVMNQVREGLELNCKEYYWSDSSIVIAWLKRKDDLNIFVYNRVKEILQRTSTDDWHHVPGDMNPADLPSRGCDADKLLQTSWWTGPVWLRKPPKEWPVIVESPDMNEVLKEVKKSTFLMINDSIESFSSRLTYFSKYHKIVRLIAWCRRFANNCITRASKRTGSLSTKEYIDSERYLLQLLQREDECVIASKIQTFRGTDGLLRVKTRLTLSDELENFINPIVLTTKSVIVSRLVAQEHIRLAHAGTQTLISKLRETYWIIGIRRLAKKAVRDCIRCQRYSVKQCVPPPGPLPLSRISCGSAFEVTGIDLAGPLILKARQKCWIVLFTCAVYRAVHLEITMSLSSEDFLLALRRFLARRGNVRVIYSDNGTNFHGVNNMFQKVNHDSVYQKIEWRFIVPSAPWWGGFWERMVRTVKEVLRRNLGRAALSEVELYTVLCEAENLINARPLTYVADDSENVRPLTPSMFLNINCDGISNNDMDKVDGHILSSRWRYLKTVNEHLKERFKKEYLSLLLQRSSKAVNEVRVGDVVLIGDDDTKRVNWPLGLVVEVMPGVDGQHRVARIKTATGQKVRALQRIYRLELAAGSMLEKVSVTRSGRPIRLPDRLRF